VTDFDDTDFDDTTEDDGNANIKALRQAARDGKRAKADADAARSEAEAARRELAFVRLGIDPDSKNGKLLAKAHEGEISVDALRATAVEYGLLDAPKDEKPVVSDQELAAHAQFSNTVAGGENVTEYESAVSGLKEIDWQDPHRQQKVFDILQKAGVGRDDSGVQFIPGAAVNLPAGVPHA
jgi:hypothetical protein